LDHSKRIIEIFGKLLQGHSNLLNKHEIFILLASAYLHDIGMQSPRHAGLPDKSEYTIEDLEKVREKHHEASAQIIIESVSNESALSLGL
jgi:HD superfamily phosphodiesterase